MANKYFHEQEFQYSIKLLEHDPYGAKERFEAYLEKYPDDYYARAYYVILLTRICLIDEAEKEYKTIIQETRNNNFYDCNSIKKLKGFRYNMLLCELKILGYKEKYQRILNLLYKYKDESMFNDIDYRFNQCVNYSDEAFRNHIK